MPGHKIRCDYLGESNHSDKPNTKLYFLDTDSEELYDKNLSILKNRNKLKRFGYTRDNVRYELNEYGFRADTFDDKPGFMFLGCSFTIGLGVDDADIWPRNLSDKYNMRMFNLGQSGSGGDTALRLAHWWFPKLDVRGIFFLEPNINRREFVNIRNGKYIINLLTPGLTHGWDDWMEMAASGETNRYNSLKNKLALKCLCRSKNIPFFTLDWQHTDKGGRGKNGRDLLHPNEEWHTETMTKFDKMYKNHEEWREY